jgi:putative phosphoribosyl transferase
MLATRTFLNREHAGRQLARSLERFAPHEPIVMGIRSLGLAVARLVSDRLDAQLEVIVVEVVSDAKHSGTQDPPRVIGAVSERGITALDRGAIQSADLDEFTVESSIQQSLTVARRRAALLRGSRPIEGVHDRWVIIVDDSLMEGTIATAAIASVRRAGAGHVVVAAPVGCRSVIENLQVIADEVVCPSVSELPREMRECYDEPEETTDTQAAALLRDATRREVELDISDPHGRGWAVRGTLAVPRGAVGAVVFAHGSGSSRHSPRNSAVADALNEAGFATLLFDLLSEEEAHDRHNVFDVDFLARRLISVIDWCAEDEHLRGLPLGLFGASTGAAAALIAAAQRPDLVRAVVSRGGRPDLAMAILDHVQAPTLLIVGGADPQVQLLNEQALSRLGRQARLQIVPGATHLFEEAGALEEVIILARSWFDEYLHGARGSSSGLIRYRRIS